MYTKIKNQLAIDWPIVKLGNLIEVRSSKRVLESDWTDVGVPFYRGRDVNKLSKKEDISPVFISHEKYLELKRLTGVPKIGDIIITAIGTLGKIHIVDNEEPFYFKDGTILWFKINNRIRSDYLKFLFLSNVILDQIKYFNNITTVGAYTIDTARNTLIILPDINKQIQISNFLNKNCDKIDNEVALLQQKSILLDEYKNALIYETVTKGLDKNAEMKDIGSNWIGEAVASWPIKRLKDVYIYKNGYAFSDEDYCDESESYLVKITNIGSEHNFKNMQNLEINELTEKFRIKNNSILYALSGSVGKCSFYNSIENKGCYLNQRVAELTIKNGNVKYFYYVMSNNSFKNEILGMIQGNVIKNLNKGHLDNSFTPVPNIETQNEIVKYLDNETYKIEKQIELINKKVELLKEYKQSLIYEAVTGQLEIE